MPKQAYMDVLTAALRGVKGVLSWQASIAVKVLKHFEGKT